MNLEGCHNYDDFRKLAKKKLPSPIFHYIDGGSDDEVTLNRNTDSFNNCGDGGGGVWEEVERRLEGRCKFF